MKTKKNKALSPNLSYIGKELGISKSYVSMILSGKRHSQKYESKIKVIIKKAAEELKTKAA